jgi:hypothetical protein
MKEIRIRIPRVFPAESSLANTSALPARVPFRGQRAALRPADAAPHVLDEIKK